MIYLQKWKRLLSAGLLYNIKVIEDTIDTTTNLVTLFRQKFSSVYNNGAGWILPREVLSEERQLMKWVGIFQGGVWWVGIFPGGIFLKPLFLKRAVKSLVWKTR